jgi:hypothetical protein
MVRRNESKALFIFATCCFAHESIYFSYSNACLKYIFPFYAVTTNYATIWKTKARRNKISKKMCRVSARRLSIYNFALGLLKASNLQAESKVLKKSIGTPNLSIKTLTWKREVSRLKGKKGKKVMWITKFADRRQTADGRPTEIFFRQKSLFYR